MNAGQGVAVHDVTDGDGTLFLSNEVYEAYGKAIDEQVSACAIEAMPVGQLEVECVAVVLMVRDECLVLCLLLALLQFDGGVGTTLLFLPCLIGLVEDQPQILVGIAIVDAQFDLQVVVAALLSCRQRVDDRVVLRPACGWGGAEEVDAFGLLT